MHFQSSSAKGHQCSSLHFRSLTLGTLCFLWSDLEFQNGPTAQYFPETKCEYLYYSRKHMATLFTVFDKNYSRSSPQQPSWGQKNLAFVERFKQESMGCLPKKGAVSGDLTIFLTISESLLQDPLTFSWSRTRFNFFLTMATVLVSFTPVKATLQSP